MFELRCIKPRVLFPQRNAQSTSEEERETYWTENQSHILPSFLHFICRDLSFPNSCFPSLSFSRPHNRPSSCLSRFIGQRKQRGHFIAFDKLASLSSPSYSKQGHTGTAEGSVETRASPHWNRLYGARWERSENDNGFSPPRVNMENIVDFVYG